MQIPSILRVGFVFAVTLSFAANPPAHAGPITNPDFSDGLNGYEYTLSPLTGDPDVTAANNQATLNEDAFLSEVDLTQTVTIPVGATLFSFDLISYSLDTTFINPNPDGFNAALLDRSGNSLVPVASNSTDSYFTQDLTAGASPVLASGVTLSPVSGLLSPADGAPPYTVTVDVSALGGQTATILFRLIGGGDNTDDTVVISNLVLGSPLVPSSVPEPSSIVLAWIGVSIFACSYLIRQRRFSFSICLAGANLRKQC